MQSLLVKLASIAVMFHMTLGCHWHHGLGVQACLSDCSAEICQHQSASGQSTCCNDIHEHADQEHGNLPATESVAGDGGEHHGHCHLSCQDDGCNAIQICKFVYWPLNFETQYLSGAEDSALILSQAFSGLDSDPFPDCSHTAMPVRAHLLFGVQIL